ncbi:hypothetical protein O181_045248 [Austropuccinia psidii MF-1]|uniref:Integrase catalytic domain-containing protein n=1 Tax=Austropuccinia psidii MF-1 TaxID=1389203 RepID=A0A9Q3DPY1_9BASI|nr:hypothetical protein [Austropuccinia psidii MF-1]
MDWVTHLPPGGDRIFNAFPVLGDSYRKTPIFFPFHKHYKAMSRAIMIWNKLISHTGLFQKTISDRYLKFTSELFTNIHNLIGKKFSFSKAYRPQTNGIAKRMIKTQEDMMRRFGTYGLEFK